MENNLRYIISVLIETQSCLVVNSGDRTLLLDNAIVRDASALPFIPGTSIAGVMKHLYEDLYSMNDAKSLFGYTSNRSKDKGQGSRLVFSDAQITAADGKTIQDGIMEVEDSHYFESLMQIPERDHVKLNDKGVVNKSNKYDRQILHAGNRFGFEIELIGNAADAENWKELTGLLYHPLFRLGSGTRNGSGRIEVLETAERIYDLTKKTDLEEYLNKNASLNNTLAENRSIPQYKSKEYNTLKDYSLSLKPRDFFLFGTSLPDAEVDNKPKTEQRRLWLKEGGVLKEQYLIPATSIKGALSHRTAFHFNRLQGKYIGDNDAPKASDFGWDAEKCVAQIEVPSLSDIASDDHESWQEQIDKIENIDFETFINNAPDYQAFIRTTDGEGKKQESLPVGDKNPAVVFLFGAASDSDEAKGSIGRVLIEDIYIEDEDVKTHIFNHVKIDRLTGGAFSGALFQEKPLYTDKKIELRIKLNLPKEKPKDFDNMLKAFECALDDLKNEHLPLGGATTKGYGFFREAV